MGDSYITILAIFIAVILMFGIPLLSMSIQTDKVSQLTAQTATTNYGEDVKVTGEITKDNYDKFNKELTSTGNSFEVDITLQILDENPGVKTTQAEMTKIGENLYYTYYTSQVEEMLEKYGKITLKEGDRITITVKNTNQTIAQILTRAVFGLTGNNTYANYAEYAGMITRNGTK